MQNGVNTDRIITMERTDGGGSWRNNLYHIMNSQSKRAEHFMFENSKSDEKNYNVLDCIDLLMESTPKTWKASNDEPSAPVKDALDAVSGLASKTNIDIEKIAKVAFAVQNRGTNTTSAVWQPWTRNLIAWNGAKSGIEIEYEFKFRMGQYGLWNAKEEVVKPVINLLAPALPQYINSYSMAGPFPQTMQLIASLNLKEAWRSARGVTEESTDTGTTQNDENELGIFEKLGGFIENLVNQAYEPYTYTLKFGKVSIYNRMIVRDGSCTFSNEVDQYGYPVSGSCTLKFVGAVPLSLASSTSTNMASRFGIDLSTNNERIYTNGNK